MPFVIEFESRRRERVANRIIDLVQQTTHRKNQTNSIRKKNHQSKRIYLRCGLIWIISENREIIYTQTHGPEVLVKEALGFEDRIDNTEATDCEWSVNKRGFKIDNRKRLSSVAQ